MVEEENGGGVVELKERSVSILEGEGDREVTMKLENNKANQKCWRTTHYGDLRQLCRGNWACQRVTNKEIRPPSSKIEEDLALNTHRLHLSQTTQIIALTTQSHLLASTRGMLATLQSPQRVAMKEGQEDRAKRFLSGA